jgi:Na+-translocating ferredoxin:NAD+ oxidoreductase subunit B
MAAGIAPINQCPPGGAEGISRLAKVFEDLGPRPADWQSGLLPTLNPTNGAEVPRAVAVIDENWCIGCTLCVAACPVDAILGANKRMHTVIEPHCTGCELCLPVCPVDCITMENATDNATGWSAWSHTQARSALNRYELRSMRRSMDGMLQHRRQVEKLEQALEDLPKHSNIEDPALLEKKSSIVVAALARARARNTLIGI